MAEETTIEVTRRDDLGSSASRRLRASGQVPAVVYGGGVEPLSIQVGDHVVRQLLRASGENAVFLLQLAGTDQSRHTMIKQIQYDSTNDALVHIDFQRVKMDEMVRVKVAVETEGVPEGVKTEGGMIDFITRELEIECLPGDIPEHLTLDVSEMHVGQHAEAGAVQLPPRVTLIDEESKVILAVSVAPAVVAEETEEEEETLIEAEAEEPEVAAKGKAEEDSE